MGDGAAELGAAHGYGLSFRGDENVIKSDYGDGYTAP